MVPKQSDIISILTMQSKSGLRLVALLWKCNRIYQPIPTSVIGATLGFKYFVRDNQNKCTTTISESIFAKYLNIQKASQMRRQDNMLNSLRITTNVDKVYKTALLKPYRTAMLLSMRFLRVRWRLSTEWVLSHSSEVWASAWVASISPASW